MSSEDILREKLKKYGFTKSLENLDRLTNFKEPQPKTEQGQLYTNIKNKLSKITDTETFNGTIEENASSIYNELYSILGEAKAEAYYEEPTRDWCEQDFVDNYNELRRWVLKWFGSK